MHGAQPVPGPHVPQGPARSPALSVHESAEPGSRRRKEKDHVYHEHSTPVTLPTQDPQRTPGSQRERHRPGFGLKVPETRTEAPPGVHSRTTEPARDPGTRRQCPPLPRVLRTGAGGGLSQLERVTCEQTARPKGSSGRATASMPRSPMEPTDWDPRVSGGRPTGGGLRTWGRAHVHHAGFLRPAPTRRRQALGVRGVPGGLAAPLHPSLGRPGREFPLGLNCSPARTWRSFRCPRGVRRRLRAEHSGPQAPTPGRAGSEPGSRPSLCTTWAGTGQRAARPALPCTCHPSTDTRRPLQTHLLSLGPFFSFWSLWRQEGNRSS